MASVRVFHDTLTDADPFNCADGYRWAEILAQLNGSASVNVSWNTLTDANSYQLVLPTSASTWGGTGSTWGAVGSTWGTGGPSPYYVNLSGTGPWIDVTITDAGMAASQYSSVEINGFAYGRR